MLTTLSLSLLPVQTPAIRWGNAKRTEEPPSLAVKVSETTRKRFLSIAELWQAMQHKKKTHLVNKSHHRFTEVIGGRRHISSFLRQVDGIIDELAATRKLPVGDEQRTIQVGKHAIYVQRLPISGNSALLYGLKREGETSPQFVMKAYPDNNAMFQLWAQRGKFPDLKNGSRNLAEFTGPAASFRTAINLAQDPEIGPHIAQPVLCKPFSTTGHGWTMMEWLPGIPGVNEEQLPDLYTPTVKAIKAKAKKMHLEVQDGTLKRDDFILSVDPQQRLSWMLVDTEGIGTPE